MIEFNDIVRFNTIASLASAILLIMVYFIVRKIKK